MTAAKTDTVRKTITLSKATVRHLERLAIIGIHGSEWSGVARTFVEAGVRQAIQDDYIKLDDV